MDHDAGPLGLRQDDGTVAHGMLLAHAVERLERDPDSWQWALVIAVIGVHNAIDVFDDTVHARMSELTEEIAMHREQ
jgi:hypothetical protein